MKTKLIVELESPDKMEVFPEPGQSDEDFKGKEKELQKFREDYVKSLHEELVSRARNYFDNEDFEENFLDNAEEVAIEDYEDFNQYGIKVKTEIQKGG